MCATPRMRCVTAGSWTFVIGSEFELIDNGDSVQAAHEDRVVYVSALRVRTSARSVSAAELRAAAASQLGSGERVSHVGSSEQGDAEIRPEGDAWCLCGTMCADGSVVTCLIDYVDARDRDWAVSVWSSLRCDGAAE